MLSFPTKTAQMSVEIFQKAEASKDARKEAGTLYTIKRNGYPLF